AHVADLEVADARLHGHHVRITDDEVAPLRQARRGGRGEGRRKRRRREHTERSAAPPEVTPAEMGRSHHMLPPSALAVGDCSTGAAKLKVAAWPPRRLARNNRL